MTPRITYCPETADGQYDNCLFCFDIPMKIGDDKWDVEHHTLCGLCRGTGAESVRGECISDPMADAWDCSNSTEEHQHGCAMCRNQMTWNQDWTYCVSC